jgi:Domain of unknown function (DUF4340)
VNNKRLPIAIIALVGVAGAFVATRRAHEPEATPEKPKVTLPAVKRDEVTSITIEQAQKPTITLEKGEGGWLVKAPVGAKADQAAVDSMLDKLSDWSVQSVAATHKENYAKLEVDPEHAIHVVARAKEATVADVFLGATKSSGTMLRVSGQEPVLAVKGSLRWAFDKDVTSVRDRVITDLAPEELTALSVRSEKGTFRFEKGEKEWAQAKGEKPLKAFAADKVQSLATAFAHLRASGFADEAATPQSTGLEPAATELSLTTKDGKTVTLVRGALVPDGTDYYLRASGSDVLYRVSKYTGDRMGPDAAAFAPAENKPAGGPPPGMQPVAGGGNLPPEVLKQLQQQLAAQGH